MQPSVEVNLLGALLVAVEDRLSAEMRAKGQWSLSGAAALNVLANQPDLSVKELSAAIGLTQSATVRLVDRLVDGGSVERRVAGPGRTLALRLTERGLADTARAQRARLEVLAEVLEAVPAARRESFLADVLAAARAVVPDLPRAQLACRLCDQRRCVSAGCPLPRSGPR